MVSKANNSILDTLYSKIRNYLKEIQNLKENNNLIKKKFEDDFKLITSNKVKLEKKVIELSNELKNLRNENFKLLENNTILQSKIKDVNRVKEFNSKANQNSLNASSSSIYKFKTYNANNNIKQLNSNIVTEECNNNNNTFKCHIKNNSSVVSNNIVKNNPIYNGISQSNNNKYRAPNTNKNSSKSKISYCLKPFEAVKNSKLNKLKLESVDEKVKTNRISKQNGLFNSKDKKNDILYKSKINKFDKKSPNLIVNNLIPKSHRLNHNSIGVFQQQKQNNKILNLKKSNITERTNSSKIKKFDTLKNNFSKNIDNGFSKEKEVCNNSNNNYNNNIDNVNCYTCVININNELSIIEDLLKDVCKIKDYNNLILKGSSNLNNIKNNINNISINNNFNILESDCKTIFENEKLDFNNMSNLYNNSVISTGKLNVLSIDKSSLNSSI